MADINLNSGGNARILKRFDEIAGATTFALDFGSTASANMQCMTDGGTALVTAQADMDMLALKTNMANAYTLAGVRFTRGGVDYVVKASGKVQTAINPSTGEGTEVGDMTPGLGAVVINTWAPGGSPAATNFRGIASAPINGPFSPYGGYEVMFRTSVAPLRPSGFNVTGELKDGTTFNVTADDDGFISATRVKGKINYQTGVATLFAVTPTAPGQVQVDLSFLAIPGVSMVYLDQFRPETIRYNAVAYTYLPIDAEVIGIDPVRLPSDGKVPIFKRGGVFVIGNTQETAAATRTAPSTVDLGRERLSRVIAIGADGNKINTGWTVDLESGLVSITSVAGWSQPVKFRHRVEDMRQIRDAQINGEITFTPALSHDYPAEGSYISSALLGLDLTARVSLIFDQATWDLITYTDAPVGGAAPGTYNDTNYPIEVTNEGAENQRWVARFMTNTTVQISGEHVGVLGTFSIGTDIAPLNPVSDVPYFRIPQEGWGSGGWAVGNIVRFNTVGARFTLWAARTIKPGPYTGEDYNFELLARGDVDNPIV